MEVKVKNSKIDIGLSKLFMNKQHMDNILNQQDPKTLEIFYDVNLGGTQYFQSDWMTDRQIQTLMEWNQTFAFQLETGTEKVNIRLVLTSLILGEVVIDQI
jgi:hypothetical protein